MRVAAIDCGTNSIRLLIADVVGRSGAADVVGRSGAADVVGRSGAADVVGRSGAADVVGPVLIDVTRRMEIVRLGEGVDRTGRLAPEAIARTRKALAGYTAELRGYGCERVRMVATSASRDAANAADFRAMVLDTLGVEPEVISGDEEARLSFTGAVRGLGEPGPFLVVDIGGGSTEFVTGGSAVEHAVSVDIGCVRMTERHLPDDPPSAAQVAAVTADVTGQVDRALGAVRAADVPRQLVGLAGSVTTVAALAGGLDRYDPARIHRARVPLDAVRRVTTGLLTSTRAQRLVAPVMHPGRADVIGAGALILQVIMERAGMSDVIASEHDILDGIAFSAAAVG